jgi:hypothetical protein
MNGGCRSSASTTQDESANAPETGAGAFSEQTQLAQTRIQRPPQDDFRTAELEPDLLSMVSMQKKLGDLHEKEYV